MPGAEDGSLEGQGDELIMGRKFVLGGMEMF